MPLYVIILIFIAVMAGISVPVITAMIFRRSMTGNHPDIDELREKVEELEQKVNGQQNEIKELTSNLEFTTRLIEKD